MEKYTLEIFLYLPLAMFIIMCLLSKYVFKERRGTTVGDLLTVLVFCSIPVLNISIFLWYIFSNIDYDKRLW